MIRHILLFRFNEGVSEELQAETIGRLRRLEQLCPTIGGWCIGVNSADSPSAYDIVEIGDFATWEDLDAYKAHQAHRDFSDFVRQLATWALADFELNEQSGVGSRVCGAPVACFYPACGSDCMRGDQALMPKP